MKIRHVSWLAALMLSVSGNVLAGGAPSIDFSTTLTGPAGPVTAGSTVSYSSQPGMTVPFGSVGTLAVGAVTLTFSNNASAGTALTSVAGFSFAGGAWSCSGTTLPVTCSNATAVAPFVVGSGSIYPLAPIQVNYTATGTTNTSNGLTTAITSTVLHLEDNPGNETASLGTSVTPGTPPDLSIAITPPNDPVLPNLSFGYSYTISNSGAATSGPTTLAINLSNVTSGVTFNSSGWSCTGTGTVTCVTSNSIGASANFFVLFTAPIPSTPSGSIAISNNSTISTPGEVNTSNNSATANNTVRYTDHFITASPATSTVIVPATVDIDLNADFSGTQDFFEFDIDTTLPAGISFNSIQLGSPAWLCTPTGSALNCSFQIASRESRGSLAPPLRVRLDVATAGTRNLNFVLSNNGGNPEPNTSNDSATVTINGTPPNQDLSISKTVVGGPSFPAGSSFAYTLAVSNLSTLGSAPNVLVQDDLPEFMQFISATGTNWACSSAASPLPNRTRVTCNLAALASATSAAPITLNVRWNSGNTGSVPNTATVSSGLPDPVSTNNSSTANVTITSSTDLQLTLTDSADPVDAGVSFNYLASVRNLGPSLATQASLALTANLSQVEILAASGTGWSCGSITASPITCTYSGAAVAANADFATLTVQTRGRGVLTDTTHTLQGTVSTTAFDPSSANNSASQATLIRPASSLSINVDDSTDPVIEGQSFDYLIAVKNEGPSPQSSLSLSATLANALSFQSFAGSEWSCTNSGQVVNCLSSAVLAAGASRPLSIRVRSQVGTTGSITQSFIVAGNSAPSISGSETTNIVARATISLSHVASRSPVAVGEPFDFQIRLTNNGPQDGNGAIVLNDVSTRFFEVLGVGGDGWTCTLSGNRIDCRRSNVPVGTQPPINVRVRALQAGSLTNVASATIAQAQQGAQATALVEANAISGNLAINKAARQVIAQVGQVDFDIDIGNVSSVTANEVVVTDNLPSNLELLSLTANGFACSGTSQLSCRALAPLPPGASARISLRARVLNVPASGCLNISNTATVSSATPDNNPADNSSTARIDVCAGGGSLGFDLRLDVDPAALTAPAGSTQFAFSSRISNVGDRDAPISDVTLNLPAGFELAAVQVITGNFSCTPNANSACRLPIIAPGQFVELRPSIRVLSGAANGSVQARVTAANAIVEGNLSNNAASVSVSVPQALSADLAVTLTGPTDVIVGSNASYRAVITNNGPASATAVAITLQVPAGAVVLGAPSNCTVSTTPVCSLGNLAAAASISFDFLLRSSDQAGSSPVIVQVGSNTIDPAPANNRASLNLNQRNRNTQELIALLDPCVAGDRFAQSAVAPLAELCANPTADTLALCGAVVRAAQNQCNGLRDALTNLAPEEVLAQSLMLKDFANTQFFNIDARLSQLRGGGGGFSISGLNFGGLNTSLLAQIARAAAGEDDESSFDQDLVSPWGFFVNGSISDGEQDLNTGRARVGVDFESKGITAGVDYRFSSRLVGGLALGFADFDSDLIGNSTLDMRGLSFTGYASWYPSDRFFLDGRLSFGRASFDLDRRITITLGGLTSNQLARGSTDADQLTFAASTGYHFNRGGWNITPNASLRYIQSDVDAFNETGAGAFNLGYDEQSVDSLQFALGVQINRAISLERGVLSPQFDLSFNHEAQADDLVVEARLLGRAGTQTFIIADDSPDKNFGNMGLGFVYITSNGRQAYVNYRRNFAQDGFDRGILNIGTRFEF